MTTGQTDGQTDAGQSDPYVPLCFAGDIKSPSSSGDFQQNANKVDFILKSVYIETLAQNSIL